MPPTSIDSMPPDPTTLREELKAFLESGNWTSLEEVNSAAARFMRQHNQRPQDDFRGLSPEHMAQILNRPFDSPGVALFEDPLTAAPPRSVPALVILEGLAEAIGGDGIRTTATGNLPVRVCREIYHSWEHLEDGERIIVGPNGPRNETDFADLHKVRVSLQLGGLLRKRKGRLYWTRKAAGRLTSGGALGLYPALLRTYIEKFNWGYSDGYPDVPFIQHSFLFALYLLDRTGDSSQRPKPRPGRTNGDASTTSGGAFCSEKRCVLSCDQHQNGVKCLLPRPE